MTRTYRPVLLVILDGVGVNPRKDWNAVEAAKKPFYDRLYAENPHVLIKTSGEDVGLPEGVMGNSEVGHLNIGAGRVVYQSLTRINKSVREGSFYENPVILSHFREALARGKRIHLMGLLSTGGVHADIKHIEALLEIARRLGAGDRLLLHPFLDGRDMPPTSGAELLERLRATMNEKKTGRIATLCGRYYAMDRDKRWDRTEKAWRALVLGEGAQASDPAAALRDFYETGKGDEFVLPVVVEGTPRIEAGDAVFFWNYRPDRARQITRALMMEGATFDGFVRPVFPRVHYASMLSYDATFPWPVAFPDVQVVNSLPEVLAARGLRQFHTAETEKYAHVTYFFAGMKEAVQKGEDRALVASPKVATYDLQPEMSAEGVTREVEKALTAGYDFIVVNFANGDMVGHTGVYEAAVAAVEAVDGCIARIVPRAVAMGGAAIVTADHGNAEQMRWYETGEPHTQHTTFPVNLIVAGAGPLVLREGGRLANIAPTVLDLLGIEKPSEMEGETLILRGKEKLQ